MLDPQRRKRVRVQEFSLCPKCKRLMDPRKLAVVDPKTKLAYCTPECFRKRGDREDSTL